MVAYIVMDAPDYDPSTVKGIFSTLEKALELAKKIGDNDYYIQECIVDAPVVEETIVWNAR